jgi:predicted GIY-YIG superfamily endonuclease
VPVVIVFTQWDRLVQQKIGETDTYYQNDENMTRKQIREIGEAKAREHYECKLYNPLVNMLGHSNRAIIRRTELPPNEGSALPAANGLDKMLKDTCEILTSDGLRTLLTLAQRVDADSKLKESLSKGIEVFSKVRGWSSVPFVPGLSVATKSIAFEDVYRMICQLWNIPTEPLDVFERDDIRRSFYEASFDTATWAQRGMDIFRVFDISGPATTSIILRELATLVVGVSLICELLFWRHKKNGGQALTESMILNTLRSYRASEERSKASATIEYRLKALNAFKKEECVRALQQAIKMCGSEIYREMLKEETVAKAETSI